MADGQQPKILDQTLGEVLQNNPQAQGIVMNAMNITPQQLQEMLGSTGNNPYMNMKISDMFKNGVFQQAMQMNPGMGQGMPMGQGIPMMATGQAVQITKEQYQQLMQAMQNGQPIPLNQLPIQQIPGMQGMNGQVPVQQVVLQQIPGQQVGNGQVVGQLPVMVPVQNTKPSFFQRLKNLFK